MKSEKEIATQILRILKGKVMNTMEVCRALNGGVEREVCNSVSGFRIDKNGNKVNRSMMKICKGNGCKIHYFIVLKTLHNLLAEGKVKKRKMRFWDYGTKGKRSDVFSFWYLDDELFHNQILRQTLEGYL